MEANGVISPALTPSPSPLPLTIEEDREFTYPADVLVPPVGNYFDLPRIRLPPGIMIKLREISGRARPQFRPSIKYVQRVGVPANHDFKFTWVGGAQWKDAFTSGASLWVWGPFTIKTLVQLYENLVFT